MLCAVSPVVLSVFISDDRFEAYFRWLAYVDRISMKCSRCVKMCILSVYTLVRLYSCLYKRISVAKHYYVGSPLGVALDTFVKKVC